MDNENFRFYTNHIKKKFQILHSVDTSKHKITARSSIFQYFENASQRSKRSKFGIYEIL